MKKQYISYFIVVITLMMLQNSAWASNWHYLGGTTVNDLTETDLIMVGAEHGRLSKLRLDINRAPVELKRAVVTFGNGDKQIIERNRIIGKQGKGPVLQLDGGKRFVKSVKLVYETVSPGFKRAKAKLYGK